MQEDPGVARILPAVDVLGKMLMLHLNISVTLRRLCILSAVCTWKWVAETHKMLQVALQCVTGWLAGLLSQASNQGVIKGLTLSRSENQDEKRMCSSTSSNMCAHQTQTRATEHLRFPVEYARPSASTTLTL